MSKRKTNQEFIEESVKTHGDKYDYSKVSYSDNRSKIIIICPIHGEFWQSPIAHLRGNGCPKCGRVTKKLCGIGNNDIPNSHNTIYYKYWSRMIKRCYYNDRINGNKNYFDCFVCKDWHNLSSFKLWFDKNYIYGWELDKDILVKGNREYSPDKCCFVPQSINALFTKRERLRGDLPIGVSSTNGIKNPYRAYISDKSKQKRIGVYETPEQAFDAYKKEKECLIKEIANKYKDKLNENVYNALINYKVEITD